MRKIVGLTGGIGSGKTTVAQLLELQGYPVYYADEQAKKLLSENKEVKNKVRELLGSDIFDSNEVPDRKKIAEKVFSDSNLLAGLNAILHPATRQDFSRWAESRKDVTLLFKEAAILYEAGSDADCDEVLLVYAPMNLRIERVCIRDGLGEAEVKARIEKQWPEFEKLQRAGFVIYNDGIHEIAPQVEAALAWLLNAEQK